jgi:hypothetical protein
MEEEKVLLKIALDGEVTLVSFKINDTNELAAVALPLHNLIKKTPELAKMLLCVQMTESMGMSVDPVEAPDFDKILKQSSNGN